MGEKNCESSRKEVSSIRNPQSAIRNRYRHPFTPAPLHLFAPSPPHPFTPSSIRGLPAKLGTCGKYQLILDRLVWFLVKLRVSDIRKRKWEDRRV